jgi:hypothetical protein
MSASHSMSREANNRDLFSMGAVCRPCSKRAPLLNFVPSPLVAERLCPRRKRRARVTFARTNARNLGALFSHDDYFGKLVYAIELHLGQAGDAGGTGKQES